MTETSEPNAFHAYSAPVQSSKATVDSRSLRNRSMNMKVALLTAMVCSIASVNATVTTKKYKVSGSTTDELIASLDTNGPGGGWGRMTPKWSPGWTYAGTDGAVKIGTVNPGVTKLIEMPTWRGYTGASKCMKESWDDMYANLLFHENEHVKIADRYTAKMVSELKAIPPQNDTDAVDAAANTKLTKLYTDHQAAQDKFDSDTDRGRNAGDKSIVLAECPA